MSISLIAAGVTAAELPERLKAAKTELANALKTWKAKNGAARTALDELAHAMGVVDQYSRDLEESKAALASAESPRRSVIKGAIDRLFGNGPGLGKSDLDALSAAEQRKVAITAAEEILDGARAHVNELKIKAAYVGQEAADAWSYAARCQAKVVWLEAMSVAGPALATASATALAFDAREIVPDEVKAIANYWGPVAPDRGDVPALDLSPLDADECREIIRQQERAMDEAHLASPEFQAEVARVNAQISAANAEHSPATISMPTHRDTIAVYESMGAPGGHS